MEKKEAAKIGGTQSGTVKISGFVRPLRVPLLKELLGKSGVVLHCWMDSIKTHCFVSVRTAHFCHPLFRVYTHARTPQHAQLWFKLMS